MTESSDSVRCWSSSELKKYIFSSIKELGMKPSHNLGQNFLIDAVVIKYHLAQAELTSTDVVLEIGPGLGNLTKCIIPQVKKVYVIESDKRICAFLKEEFSVYSNVEIIIGDAVKVEWPKFSKCLSNLPYQISSPVTFKLLNHDFDLSILMYQKEFAERLIARPGVKQYSRLSVMLKIKANCKYLMTVKRSSFYPQPKVDSALVKIIPHKPLIDAEDFQNFVTILFNNKGRTVRALIRNYLKNIKIRSEIFQSALGKIEKLSSRRIFTLKVSEIIELYNILKEVIGRGF